MTWCEQLALELIKAFPTIVIAAIAVGISWKQAAVARAKFDLDLFHERYRLFNVFADFLRSRITAPHGLIEDDPEFKALALESAKFRFLFGAEIEKLVQDAIKRGAIFSYQRSIVASGGAPQMVIDATGLAHKELTWFLDTLKELTDPFVKYMDFADWHKQ